MALETVNEPEQGFEGEAPGALLKAAREKVGYSLEDISRDTRITMSRLRALEADDYGRVGSNTFVVGYIRQYAKWLGIPADELVQSFEERAGAAGESTLEVPPASPKGSPRLPLVWLVVVLVLVWVVAGIALTSGSNEESARQEPSVSSASETEALEQPSEPVVEAGANSGGGFFADGQDLPARAEEVPVDSGADQGGGTGALSDTPEVEQTAVQEEADTLTMSFAGECWVEVKDANGQLLFAQLQQAGDNLRLVGQAPFSVVLGNARAATVDVNGRVIDTDPGPNRNTMRLNAGP